MDEKLRFIEEKKLARTIEAEKCKEQKEACPKRPESKAVTNPIASAFLKFVQTKHKFNIKDL